MVHGLHSGSRILAGLLPLLLAAPVLAFDLSGDGSDTSNADHIVLGACPECAVPVAPPEGNPSLTSWSLGLRGSYVSGGPDGGGYKAIVLPSGSFGFVGSRNSYLASGTAELSVTPQGDASVDYLAGRVEGSYRLDQSTGFAGNVRLDVGTPNNASTWLDPNVAVAGQSIVGAGEGALSREVGPFTFTARGTGRRVINGPDTLIDSSIVDATHKNYWSVGTGLRASYAIGPVVSVFADLNAARQLFDIASPYLGVKQDNDTYTALLGVRAGWGDTLVVQAAAGATLRQFADPSLDEVKAGVATASATWRPNETLALAATASYGLGAETVTGTSTTPVEAALGLEARYLVNPWLTLRGTAGWSETQKVGSALSETRYQLGLGADYAINPRAKFSADYAYSWRQREPDPPQDEHRASIGVTFSR